MIMEDILFKNFDGTSSAHYDPIVGTLVCSSAEVSYLDQAVSRTNNAKEMYQYCCREYYHHNAKWQTCAMEVYKYEQ